MSRFLPLLFFLCCTSVLCAQYTGEEKFGRISDEDRSLMVVPGDSSAEAYVLYDKLDLRFNFLPEKGPVLLETFHRRIKLLRPSSFERANVHLSYDRSSQSISSLDARVHLPDGTTIKLRNSDFIREHDADGPASIRFTLPQITPGAVIEYEYTLMSEHIMTPSRYVFQEDIPVRWAEYTAHIPEYYNYVSLGTNGDFHIAEVERTNSQWSPPSLRGYSREELPRQRTMRYVMKDIEPFKPQPYTNNLRDYLPRVRLQLASVQYPRRPIQPIFNDWKKLAGELDDLPKVGRAYRVKGNYNQLWKEAEPVVMAGETPADRLAAAYYFIASRLRWDESYSFVGSDSPDRILAAGVGNSADLNLCLLALLHEAGITASPLLVGLRDRGAPIELYPLIDQFNHLMVYAELPEGSIFLDANGVNRPPGLPRVQALNHRGWIANVDNPRWISVEVPRARRIILCNMEVDAAGQAKLDVTGKLESYFGYSGREQLRSMKNPQEGPIASNFLSHFPEATVSHQETVSGHEHAAQPLIQNVHLEVTAGVATDDYLYVQPILLPLLDSELDDVEERLYPIDFPYPWREQYIANVSIPEGYVVEELPGSIRLVSEDGGMRATYRAASGPGQTINVNFTVDMDRTVYAASDYAVLRVMYQRIIELQEASIVLKRAK